MKLSNILIFLSNANFEYEDGNIICFQKLFYSDDAIYNFL